MESRPNILTFEKETDAKPCLEIGKQKMQMVNDITLQGVKIDDKSLNTYKSLNSLPP